MAPIPKTPPPSEAPAATTDERAGPISASDFCAWMDHVAKLRKWSGREVARQLGCGHGTIYAWREKGAPAYIALACSALACALPPWPITGRVSS